MFQKLENIYLGILRGVVLIISGGLLIGSIIFGINALKLVSSPPTFTPYTPSVAPETHRKQPIIEQYKPAETLDNPTESESTAPANTSTEFDTSSIDPLQTHYEDVANTVDTFVTNVTGETGWVNIEFVISHVKDRANSYRTYQQTQAYASDIVTYTKNILNDQSIIAVADNENVFDIANTVLDEFDQQFRQAISIEERRRDQAQQAHIQGKIEGMQSLYVAGGTFGAFLLIVFLSIFIKIERNLRHLPYLPATHEPTSSSNSQESSKKE